MASLRYGDELEVTVESIGFEGISVARHDGMVVFVSGALPGERARVRVGAKKRRYIEATAVEIMEVSPHRVAAPCPEFGVCGGCKWQHLEYGQQTMWKRTHVADAFERIGHVAIGTLEETQACSHTYGYRNKMEFSFGASRWLTREEIETGHTFETSFALGLHVPGRFDKVRSIQRCLLQSEVGNLLLSTTQSLCAEYGVIAYHARNHEGFARHLVVRTSATTGAVMSALITTTPTDENEQRFIDAWMALAKDLPDGSTLLHAINDTWSPVAIGTIVRSYGPGYLEETSHGVTYRISPFSFFQTNTQQLPELVQHTLAAAGITASDTVWDLYCGTGTLTLPAARIARHVVGVELVQSSIDDARANATRNDITNVELYAMDLHVPAAIQKLKALPQPDVIMVDPPRGGMHAMLVEHLLAVQAPRIAYVSCNPATQARDCALLAEKYDVDVVTPVDMFPQTFHIESVALLRLRA